MSTAAVPLAYPRWRVFLWRHPETWAILLSAAAWFSFFIASVSAIGYTSLDFLSFADHARHNSGSYSFFSLPTVALHWTTMIVAMMFPLLIGQLRIVAARSLWDRRDLAMALFICGYVSVWLVFGVAVEIVLELGRTIAPILRPFLIPSSFLLAALWQLAPQKKRGLVACHLTMPLAPSGWRADRDCCRYGFRTATSCCISCWAFMFVCAATGHALWAMAIVTLVSWSERVLRRPRPLYFFLGLFTVALLASLPLI